MHRMRSEWYTSPSGDSCLWCAVQNETYIARDVVIGNVAGDYTGYRNNSAQLTVDVRTYVREGTFETVSHGYVSNPAGIAIMAGIRYRRNRDYSSCGQIRDALNYVVSYAPGWNSGKVRRLADIWDRWHLSDMRAGCIHHGDSAIGDVCPEAGYEYGSKWLVEEVPSSVIRELQEMFSHSEGE